MLHSVFGKAVRDQRWALLGWGVGAALLVLIESAVWPTLRDMPDLSQFLESYPEAMQDLFDVGAMTTGTGFMNAELFTLMLPLLFIIFGVSRGSRLVAGEEEAGTLEAILVTPVSTRALVLQKAAALAVTIAFLGVVLAVTLLTCSAAFDLGIGVGDTLTGALAMVLLGIEFGWLALAVGAASGRRALALGVGGVAAVAGYVVYALGLIVDSFKSWQPLSPFEQALGDGPLGSPPPPSLIWVVLAAAVVLAASLPVFDRRDIRVH